ncbi:MAG TPA: hypothetical protein VKG84_10170 [Candidatus Acidoferrales bacterium]|nr:hypothetical protein [Candidatus Acidoferrales bacterium]
MLLALDHPAFCSHHAGWLTEKEPPQKPPPQEDLTSELLGPLGDFRTAAAVNYTLGKLVLLSASRRISPREAATIGYLCQLLLQSVHQVNNEISKTKINKTDFNDLRRILEETASLTKREVAPAS